jgi:hypothetical protein
VGARTNTLKENGAQMQIRIIIEHKYSYSHQKQICSYVKKEKREFLYLFFYKSREKHQNFKNPSQI